MIYIKLDARFVAPPPLCFIQVLFIHIIWEVLHQYDSEVFLQKIVSVSWRNWRLCSWWDHHAPRHPQRYEHFLLCIHGKQFSLI